MRAKNNYERPEAEALWVFMDANFLSSGKSTSEGFTKTTTAGVWEEEDS